MHDSVFGERSILFELEKTLLPCMLQIITKEVAVDRLKNRDLLIDSHEKMKLWLDFYAIKLSLELVPSSAHTCTQFDKTFNAHLYTV